MSDSLVIPTEIESVIQEFERTDTAFTEMDVQGKLAKAREALQNPTGEENYGAWAEVLAFALTESRQGYNPWGTHFAPMGSTTDKDGTTHYIADIDDANAAVIDHWADRARRVTHPVLKARYSDLVWELTPAIAGGRRDPNMARMAFHAYLSPPLGAKIGDLHPRIKRVLRALDLACIISEAEGIAHARASLLQLQSEAIDAKKGPWWLIFDKLFSDKRAGTTEDERQQLVGGLEELVQHYGEMSDPMKFNPHALEDAATRLIRHYNRSRRPDDVRRLQVNVGKAFEHFAQLGDATTASAVLQTAVNAYRDAGKPDESKRVRVLMQEKISQARDQMKSVVTTIEIPREDIEKFCDAIVVDDLGSTFVRIAAEFLPSQRKLEVQVQKMKDDAPLVAQIPQQIMADTYVAGKVGSVEDDPLGRLLQEAVMDFALSNVWLEQAMNKMHQTHDVMPEHYASWANRHEIFEDVTLVLEGVRAWYAGDFVKALHVLVPQVEHGLRAMVGQLGEPVTKAHPAVADVGVALSMGDILYSKKLTESLGPDLTLYFLALYADPRGKNLRNEVAHGLIKPGGIGEHLVQLLIHTLLVFGVWRELAEQRQ